jgi:hypothetical protein
MSPEFRTTSLLGPLARERVKRTGMVTSLALVVAAGVASPVAAAVQGMGNVQPRGRRRRVPGRGEAQQAEAQP